MNLPAAEPINAVVALPPQVVELAADQAPGKTMYVEPATLAAPKRLASGWRELAVLSHLARGVGGFGVSR